MIKNAPSRIDNLSLVEASGGAFGLDFGLIVGSILGSRAPYAIFTKIGTAPQREHDFRGSGGVKKRAQHGSGTSCQRQPGSKSDLGASGARFCTILATISKDFGIILDRFFKGISNKMNRRLKAPQDA